VMVWTYLSAVALLFGFATAAQLEAMRTGRIDARRDPAHVGAASSASTIASATSTGAPK
jgi:hypothetical protein